MPKKCDMSPSTKCRRLVRTTRIDRSQLAHTTKTCQHCTYQCSFEGALVIDGMTAHRRQVAITARQEAQANRLLIKPVPVRDHGLDRLAMYQTTPRVAGSLDDTDTGLGNFESGRRSSAAPGQLEPCSRGSRPAAHFVGSPPQEPNVLDAGMWKA